MISRQAKSKGQVCIRINVNNFCLILHALHTLEFSSKPLGSDPDSFQELLSSETETFWAP